MSAYFSYSQAILSLCNDIKHSIVRHPYFGEWNVCDSDQKLEARSIANGMNGVCGISEIYY